MWLMCELEFCYDFIYAVEEKLSRTVDGVDKSIGVLFEVGQLCSISSQESVDLEGIT